MGNQVDHTIVRLRVPPELKKQIEEAAEKNNRSQSAEMVARLEDSFNPREIDIEFKKHMDTLMTLQDPSTIKQLFDELHEQKALNEKLLSVNKQIVDLLGKK